MGFWDGLAGFGMSAANALWDQKEKGRDREYATKMSNTAHQREVSDLLAAGLNPVLSAGGSGASTPTIQGRPSVPIAQGLSSLTQASTGRMVGKAVAKKAAAEASTAETQGTFDQGALELYKKHPWLKAIVDVSTLMSRSRLGAGLDSVVGNVMKLFGAGSAKSIQNINNSRNITRSTTNNNLGSMIDTGTGEILPLKFD